MWLGGQIFQGIRSRVTPLCEVFGSDDQFQLFEDGEENFKWQADDVGV